MNLAKDTSELITYLNTARFLEIPVHGALLPTTMMIVNGYGWDTRNEHSYTSIFKWEVLLQCLSDNESLSIFLLLLLLL